MVEVKPEIIFSKFGIVTWRWKTSQPIRLRRDPNLNCYKVSWDEKKIRKTRYEIKPIASLVLPTRPANEKKLYAGATDVSS